MPQFPQMLNEDGLGIKTSARYDTDTAAWLADVANYIKSGAGLWVPLGDENPMPVKSLPVVATLQNAAAADGNGQTLDVAFLATVVLDIRGTFAATINFEGTVDDSSWTAIMGSRLADGEIATVATVSGLHRFDVSGLKSIRARVSGWSSGGVTVIARGTPLDGAPRSVLAKLTGSLPTGTAEIGKVAPADSGKAQQLFTQLMDFAGKTAGQTYDNPHIYKGKGSASFDAPSTYFTEQNQTSLNSASALDGATAVIQYTAAGLYSQAIFSFDLLSDLRAKGRIPKGWGVAELKAALRRVAVYWYGYGVGSNGGVSANGATLNLWKNSTSQWLAPGTNNTSAPSVIGWFSIDPSTVADRIDANGFMHFMAHSTYPSDGTIASTIYTDYIKLDVTLLTDVLDTAESLTFDRTTQMQKVISTPANVSQPLVVAPTMDFRGKTSGQTFDVPHVMKAIGNVMAASPAAFAGEQVQASYNGVAALDGQTYNSSVVVNGSYLQKLFSFDVLSALKLQGLIPQKWTAAELRVALKSITPTWVGYGGGSNGGVNTAGVYLKRWRSTAWSAGISHSASAPQALSFSVLNASDIALDIDSNGFFHMLVHSTHPSDGTIASAVYTDYVKLDVVLTGEYMMTDTGRALDHESRALRTTRVGSRTKQATIINAVSVPAGGNTGYVPLGTDGTESEVWVAINVDKGPWSLAAYSILGNTSVANTFPSYTGHATVFATAAVPALALMLGVNPAAQGLAAPTTLAEAKAMAFPLAGVLSISVTNGHATDTATVTVKVIRIWRG